MHYTFKKCLNTYLNEKLVGQNCVYDMHYKVVSKVDCPPLYRVSGNRCKLKVGKISPYCPIKTLLFDNLCYYEFVEQSISYYCSGGKLVGDECWIQDSYPATVEYEYYCDLDYELIDDYCYKKTWMGPEFNYVPILQF